MLNLANYFFFFCCWMNKDWVQESILAWLWHYFPSTIGWDAIRTHDLSIASQVCYPLDRTFAPVPSIYDCEFFFEFIKKKVNYEIKLNNEKLDQRGGLKSLPSRLDLPSGRTCCDEACEQTFRLFQGPSGLLVLMKLKPRLLENNWELLRKLKIWQKLNLGGLSEKLTTKGE